ncbi:MAG TPA: hypothetical protein VK400_11950 [Pyrinomonadaceae bacterium]|nr:hypothetical protein [Pyrinomonadaceae bacterium]
MGRGKRSCLSLSFEKRIAIYSIRSFSTVAPNYLFFDLRHQKSPHESLPQDSVSKRATAALFDKYGKNILFIIRPSLTSSERFSQFCSRLLFHQDEEQSLDNKKSFGGTG